LNIKYEEFEENNIKQSLFVLNDNGRRFELKKFTKIFLQKAKELKEKLSISDKVNFDYRTKDKEM